MPRSRKPISLTPEELAAVDAIAQEAMADLENEPGIDDLFTQEEQENAAPFYFVLRDYIHQLKEARQEANLTLAQVADKSGLAMESISRLETGAQTNPTWKTLGVFAAAVGRRPRLVAEPAERHPLVIRPDVGDGTNLDRPTKWEPASNTTMFVQLCPPSTGGFTLMASGS
jgi:transcriptional regulator with XRE-family HTH domain